MGSMAVVKVIAFSATADAAGALRFYRDQLGLELISDDPFALMFCAGGTILRVQKVSELRPALYTTLGWQVPNIAAIVGGPGEGRNHNGTFRVQRTRWIWASPSAKVAWFKNPDGNILSVTELYGGQLRVMLPRSDMLRRMARAGGLQRTGGAATKRGLGR